MLTHFLLLYNILSLITTTKPPKYEFTSQLEKNIITHIQQTNPVNITHPIQLLPNIHLHLHNITISIQPKWSNIMDNRCDYLDFFIYIKFDLIITHLYITDNDDPCSYPNQTSITLTHPNTLGIVSLFLPTFTLDDQIGWVTFSKGQVTSKQLLFNDMNDYELYNDLIRYENATQTIITHLEQTAYTLINGVLLEYPKCIYQEIFERTWDAAMHIEHRNITLRGCDVIDSLTFMSYVHVGLTRESNRLAYDNVTISINVIYVNNVTNVVNACVYFPHIYVSSNQFHSFIEQHEQGERCLEEAVKSELFISFKEVK